MAHNDDDELDEELSEALHGIFSTLHNKNGKMMAIVGFASNDDQTMEDVERAMKCLIGHAMSGHGLLPLPKVLIMKALAETRDNEDDDFDLNMFGDVGAMH